MRNEVKKDIFLDGRHIQRAHTAAGRYTTCTTQSMLALFPFRHDDGIASDVCWGLL